VPLPGCTALIVHVPQATKIAVLPETTQKGGVMDERLTGKPEEALALRAREPRPIDCGAIGTNVIVWLAPVTMLTLALAAA